jgi:UDP-perosamine 4-acetyltransferase
MNHPIRAIGIGAGGHAKVVLDILLQQKNCLIIGLLDTDTALWDTTVFGIPVLGGDEKLDRLIAQEGISAFFLGLGAVKSLARRKKLYEDAVSRGVTPLEVIHASAYISPHALLGKGATVMVAATVNAASRIGENVIINTGAIVEHDCAIGNHVHIATGAHLAGGVEVGDESMIGIGSVIRQGIRIGKRSLVGAGAVVVKDVPDDCVVAGNPAKKLTGYEI